LTFQCQRQRKVIANLKYLPIILNHFMCVEVTNAYSHRGRVVLFKNLANLFLFPSKYFLLISLKIQLLQCLNHEY